VGIGLRKYTFDSVLQQERPVASDDDDADSRIYH